MGALSDPNVAEYFHENFVSTYQQAGDFEVENVGGKIQKTGGNVASYFCTSDGRVIHAVGKPVAAQRLLTEAKWAVNTMRAVPSTVTDLRERAGLVERAHLAELGTTPQAFQQVARTYLTAARERHRRSSSKSRLFHRSTSYTLRSSELTARLMAAMQLGGDLAHKILAVEPLPRIADVTDQVFRELAGEDANPDRGRVNAAAQEFDKAQERHLPILLVLYKATGSEKQMLDRSSSQLLNGVLKQRDVAKAMRSYSVIMLPEDELSALSSLVNVPPYSLQSQSAPHIIVARPNGEQVLSMSGSVSAPALVAALWPTVVESRIERANAISSAGDISGALQLLRNSIATVPDRSLRERLKRAISKIDK